MRLLVVSWFLTLIAPAANRHKAETRARRQAAEGEWNGGDGIWLDANPVILRWELSLSVRPPTAIKSA